MGEIVCEIKDYKRLKQQLKKVEEAPEKAMKRMTRDAKKQVKGWVAAEVAKTYGIDKSEVESKAIGKVRVSGKVLSGLQFKYTGRTLTPTHFNMTPTTPNRDGYSLQATIIRGQRKTLGTVHPMTPRQRELLAKNLEKRGKKRSKKSPVMLLPVNGGNYLPFQRVSSDRKDIKAVKTVSLPQMVGGDRGYAKINGVIRRGLSDRIDYYIKKYMG